MRMAKHMMEMNNRLRASLLKLAQSRLLQNAKNEKPTNIKRKRLVWIWFSWYIDSLIKFTPISFGDDFSFDSLCMCIFRVLMCTVCCSGCQYSVLSFIVVLENFGFTEIKLIPNWLFFGNRLSVFSGLGVYIVVLPKFSVRYSRVQLIRPLIKQHFTTIVSGQNFGFTHD